MSERRMNSRNSSGLAKNATPFPNFPSTLSTDFILDVGKSDKRVIFLVNIGGVLSGQEVVESVTGFLAR
jgi:hypothetical protein